MPVESRQLPRGQPDRIGGMSTRRDFLGWGARVVGGAILYGLEEKTVGVVRRGVKALENARLFMANLELFGFLDNLSTQIVNGGIRPVYDGNHTLQAIEFQTKKAKHRIASDAASLTQFARVLTGDDELTLTQVAAETAGAFIAINLATRVRVSRRQFLTVAGAGGAAAAFAACTPQQQRELFPKLPPPIKTAAAAARKYIDNPTATPSTTPTVDGQSTVQVNRNVNGNGEIEIEVTPFPDTNTATPSPSATWTITPTETLQPTPTLTAAEISKKIVEHFGADESITTAGGKIVILVGEDGEEKEFLSASEAIKVAGYFDWLAQNAPSALDLLLTKGIQFIKNGRGQFPNRPVGIEIDGKMVWGVAVDIGAFFRPQAIQDPGTMGGFLQIIAHEAGHVAQLKGDAFDANGCLKESGAGGSKDPEMDASFVAQLFLDLVGPHYDSDDYTAAIRVQSANTSRPITCVQ